VKATYSYDDILAAYSSLGVTTGETVYVTSDLWEVRGFEKPGGKALLKAHVDAIQELIGPGGTICVPTASVHLCNTDEPFDLEKTEGKLRGAISEHVRRLPDSRRSFHPFFSYAAVGRKADALTRNAPRGAFVYGSPEYRMMDENALCLSIGKHPRFTCTTVHLVEQAMGVPYRYSKEFMHPVIRDGEVSVEPFNYFVYYLDSDIERDGNRTLFKRLAGELLMQETQLGAGTVYSYRMREFFERSCDIFNDDIYVWCETPPTQRPWRK
tara:strand:- start:93758 stop:94561 length:804 start_codon:yes stop_codon:yes gene_type:complete